MIDPSKKKHRDMEEDSFYCFVVVRIHFQDNEEEAREQILIVTAYVIGCLYLTWALDCLV